MKEFKLGPIHDADTPPVHVGVYELPDFHNDHGRCFAYWNGAGWGGRKWEFLGEVNAAVDRAYGSRFTVSDNARRWRGLTEKPKS